MKLESGYYWIKFNSNSNWETAQYDSEQDEWNILGILSPVTYGELFIIHEERILPPK